MIHALTCPVRSRWLRWRNHQPFWCDDKTANMLGVAQYGCRRCGHGAMQQRPAAHRTPHPVETQDRP
jgi:hypothetical protein